MIPRGESVIVFELPDLFPVRHGVTRHLGVLVCWDEDRDTRVLDFLDGMRDADRECLVAVQEHKGALSLVWHSREPMDYSGTETFATYGTGTNHHVAGDVWFVCESRVLAHLADRKP